MKIFSSFTPEVIEILKNGGVGVIPTDTVYGIVCSLFSQAAVERIYDIKSRDIHKPIGTVLISDTMQIEQYVSLDDLRRAEVFWPGPVSVLLDLGAELSYAHRGKMSLPFRIPDDTPLQSLVHEVGPLATTSANLPGSSPAVALQEAIDVFRESVDFYVDGGDLRGRKSSKILKFKGDTTEVIREGS